MHSLVPACHVGTVTLFEQEKIVARLKILFPGSTDRWFIAPICATCHRRFSDLNQTDFGQELDFEML